jgi:hypothetical protein
MEQPAQDQDSSIALFNKYIDPEKKIIDYVDLYKLRAIFQEQYPDQLSILNLQKRLVACCTLQELRQMEGADYSENRETLQTKLVSLFPGKKESDVEVRSALMYLLPEKSELKNEADYSNYLSQLAPDIKNVTDKLTALNNLLKNEQLSVSDLKEALNLRPDFKKEERLTLLAQHQAIKNELEISIPLHQLAHKLLNKRLKDAQRQLTSWIKSLENDIQDMENDQQSQKSAELKEFKTRLHNAKHILAQSKGEASFLQNWITGY